MLYPKIQAQKNNKIYEQFYLAPKEADMFLNSGNRYLNIAITQKTWLGPAYRDDKMVLNVHPHGPFDCPSIYMLFYQ